jgi:predicted anti-sigma-YlaC factor YlaD
MNMRCAQAHKLIGDRLEGTIGAVDKAKLEKHLEGCADCRALLADFQRIADGARELPKHEPSARVWTGVLAGVGLSDRKPARERASAPSWAERFFLQGRARTAWAAALLLVVIAGGVAIGTRLGRDAGTGTPLSADDKYTLGKLDEAEKHYQLAIEALQAAIGGRVTDLDPIIVAAFARNLGAIDGVIRECRNAVEVNPADLSARAYLLDAYKNKVEFLGNVIDVTKKPAPAKPAGTQIL